MNVTIPKAAFEALIDGRKLYFHPKTQHVYEEINRRASRASLFVDEWIFFSTDAPGSVDYRVTDQVAPLEEIVFYRDIQSNERFVRPARMFDEPTRFVPLKEYT